MAKNADVIPNQIFIGCPWKTIRSKYEKAAAQLRKKYPIHLTIVGRHDGQDAGDLLTIIKGRIETSSYAIFDATGGNANVSLEFGYAEAKGLNRAIYVNVHGAAKRAKSDSAIISDLAGKKHNQYKNEAGLLRLLHEQCKAHPYVARFEKGLRTGTRKFSKGRKKTTRAAALKVIHKLAGKPFIRRDDLVQELTAGGYSVDQVEDVLRILHRAKVLRISPGRYSEVRIA